MTNHEIRIETVDNGYLVVRYCDSATKQRVVCNCISDVVETVQAMLDGLPLFELPGSKDIKE